MRTFVLINRINLVLSLEIPVIENRATEDAISELVKQETNFALTWGMAVCQRLHINPYQPTYFWLKTFACQKARILKWTDSCESKINKRETYMTIIIFFFYCHSGKLLQLSKCKNYYWHNVIICYCQNVKITIHSVTICYCPSVSIYYCPSVTICYCHAVTIVKWRMTKAKLIPGPWFANEGTSESGSTNVLWSYMWCDSYLVDLL